jgi:hypothetical protein
MPRDSDFGARLLVGCLAAPGAALVLLGAAGPSAFALILGLAWMVALFALVLVQGILAGTLPPDPDPPQDTSARDA